MKNKKEYTVAVVGATGAVGREMIKVLMERRFPVGRLLPLASENSAGKEIKFCGKSVPVETLTANSFEGVDFALFSAGGDISLEYGPVAARAGAIVIDNSNAFRMDDDVPLVVPEVNPHAIKERPPRGIIANPNCSTIQLVVTLAPLHARAKIKRVVVDTYQSTSGAGLAAMEELTHQTHSHINAKPLKRSVFPHQIAFNCIPHIDVFEENGYTREEMKIVRETKKIMGDQSIAVTATAVRVPVYLGHSEAVSIEFASPISADETRNILAKSPGIEIVDNPADAAYPLATNAAGKDPVYVGRIRRDLSVENGIVLWIVADNLRKGAALNAVQIAELVVRNSSFVLR